MAEPIHPSELTPQQQAFPRQMLFEFSEVDGMARLRLLTAEPNYFPDGPLRLIDGKTQGYSVPGYLGDPLDDNSYVTDGYRWHDALHIGVMAGCGWSPVMRQLLGIKRRSNPKIDQIHDGARSVHLEESLFEVQGLRFVEFGDSIERDGSVISASLVTMAVLRGRGIAEEGLSRRSLEHGLRSGAQLFQEVRRNLGGLVLANLDERSVQYVPR